MMIGFSPGKAEFYFTDGVRQGEEGAGYVGQGYPGSDLDLHDDGFEDDLDLIARYNSGEVGEGQGDFARGEGG